MLTVTEKGGWFWTNANNTVHNNRLIERRLDYYWLISGAVTKVNLEYWGVVAEALYFTRGLKDNMSGQVNCLIAKALKTDWLILTTPSDNWLMLEH